MPGLFLHLRGSIVRPRYHYVRVFAYYILENAQGLTGTRDLEGIEDHLLSPFFSDSFLFFAVCVQVFVSVVVGQSVFPQSLSHFWCV